jgi:hypothetical protein
MWHIDSILLRWEFMTLPRLNPKCRSHLRLLHAWHQSHDGVAISISVLSRMLHVELALPRRV